MDRLVRSTVRKWLRLPKDITNSYFHTTVRAGGLGIPSFATTVPGLLLSRLNNMQYSSSEVIRSISSSGWISKRIKWSERSLMKNGQFLYSKELREKWWANKLHQSVDGRELLEVEKSSLSSSWVDFGSLAIPGRDYVQYSHIRINCLPTRIRTSRGVRRGSRDVNCRAGCRVTETSAHVIQNCHRTHGGRIRRHNAICKVLEAGLKNVGLTVISEPRINTTVGLRKPDIVAIGEKCASVIDAQVVSGSNSINRAHEEKRLYYAGNSGVVDHISALHNIPKNKISFTTCTLSWRGVWSSRSADSLLKLGLSKKLLASITTRALQGSHTNWSRWNKMTNVCFGYGGERAGIG